jgi:hypothetical protein
MNYKSRKPAAKKPEDSNEESKEIPPVPVVPDDESPVDKNKPGPAEPVSTFTSEYLRQIYQQHVFGKEDLRKRGLKELMMM